MDGYEQQAQLYKMLSHPVRLRILDILSRQEACVCHLTAVLGQRQPYISQQLAELRAAGLVTDRRDGTLIYYRLRDERVAAMLALGRWALQPDGGIEFPPMPSGKAVNCPCPHCQQG